MAVAGAAIQFVAIGGGAASICALIGLRQAARLKATNMIIRIAYGGIEFTATLNGNPSAADFTSMLPLELMIDDYANKEKIATLPRKLTGDGSAPFGGEDPGDLCYYVPWGNHAFYHSRYTFSRGLIRLGQLDCGAAPLFTKANIRCASKAWPDTHVRRIRD